MSLNKEVDILLQGPDTAETRGASGDPIVRKLRSTLLDGKEKYSGSKDMAVRIYSQKSHASEND